MDSNTRKVAQVKQIAEWLNNGNSINPIDALNLFGCFRLSARIKDLKDKGMNIVANIVERDGRQFAEYRLIK